MTDREDKNKERKRQHVNTAKHTKHQKLPLTRSLLFYKMGWA